LIKTELKMMGRREKERKIQKEAEKSASQIHFKPQNFLTC